MTPQALQFKTRTVPPHGKITKENFKDFANTHILVAEDNLINQKVIKGLLADTGIELTMAEDGQIAIELLKKKSNYSLILMDAHMPRVDGFEATRRIRQNSQYNHIPIIALSGDIAPDDVKKMKAAGMQEHLAKPLKISSLYDVLYAYTKQTVRNEHVPPHELNVQTGLKICDNDKQFYKEILNDFRKMYEGSTDQLGNYLQKGQLKEADALLLDIVGLTANLGADSFHAIAKNIKAAIKDTEEHSYLTLVEQYQLQLDHLLEEIKKYGQQ